VRQETAARPADDAPPRRQALVVRHRTVHLVVRFVSDPSRSLLLLEERPRIVARRELDAHGLTPREGEVLAWMAEGKTKS
jgi:hypothetical protein